MEILTMHKACANELQPAAKQTYSPVAEGHLIRQTKRSDAQNGPTTCKQSWGDLRQWRQRYKHLQCSQQQLQTVLVCYTHAYC